MMKTQKKKLKPNKRRFRINQKQLTVDYMSNLFRPKYSHVHEMVDSCNNSIKVNQPRPIKSRGLQDFDSLYSL